MTFFLCFFAGLLYGGGGKILLNGDKSGRIKVIGDNILYGGVPVRLFGQGCWTAVTRGDWDYIAEADWYKSFHSGFTRIKVINTFISDEHDPKNPWGRLPEGTFDLATWNEEFWTRLNNYLAYNEAMGRIVLLQMFDEVGIEYAADRWLNHPFHPDNNVNDLGLPPWSGVPAFYDISNDKLMAVQDAFICRLLNETLVYKNIIYEVCNEYTGPTDWVEHWIDLFAQYEAVHQIPLLLTNMSCTWANRELEMNHPGIDLLDVWHNPESIRDYTLPQIYDRFANYGSDKPIIAGRIGPEPDITDRSLDDRIFARKSLWTIFMAGGMGTCTKEDSSDHQQRWGDPFYADDNAWELYLMGLNTFVSNLGNLMVYSPNNSIIHEGPGENRWALTSHGLNKAVVYLEGGGAGPLTLTGLPDGRYFYSAFVPNQGYMTFQKRLCTENGSFSVEIPTFYQDIALLFEKKEVDVKIEFIPLGGNYFNVKIIMRSFGEPHFNVAWNQNGFPGSLYFQSSRIQNPEVYFQRTEVDPFHQVWESGPVFLPSGYYDIWVVLSFPGLEDFSYAIQRIWI